MKMKHPYIGLLVFIFLLMASCSRISEHEAAFFRCLSEQSAVGEELRTSLEQLENHLLQSGHLRSISRDDYTYLIRRMIAGSLTISTLEASPEVRDFWYLENPATFGAYPSCAGIIDENFQLTYDHSIKRMAELYRQTGMLTGADLESDVAGLAESISASDFDNIMYRGALLVFVVRLME